MYSDRYWEVFNEIDRDFDDVAVRTFKVGLPAEHDLRNSLTKKPVRSVCRLMDRINEYKRVEGDQQWGKGKLRWSHRIERMLAWIDTAITNLGEIFLGNPDLLLLRWLALCSESLCTKS